MTQNQLRLFIRACIRHANTHEDEREAALDLGRQAFKRLQDRA